MCVRDTPVKEQPIYPSIQAHLQSELAEKQPDNICASIFNGIIRQRSDWSIV